MEDIDLNDPKLNNHKHLFQIKCDQSNDEFEILGRPCELSAFSYVPKNRNYEPVERSIFNSKANIDRDKNVLDYDRLFNVQYDFNNKVHRCDRKHAKLLGLDSWSEEIKKEMPSKTNHEYGKHVLKMEQEEAAAAAAATQKVKYESNLDPPERKHVRIAKVKSEFYNRNEINDLNMQRGVL
ncbi:unnamed protein product [Brachionus calyciflorus]|uniref:Uncharacterized protein n=1 Tax=Brachionus calyciflorus TaxID=104777 RepID=A0A813MQD2_9BILA|nr:unnamed protein product [Brachionus calyciflorus]